MEDHPLCVSIILSSSLYIYTYNIYIYIQFAMGFRVRAHSVPASESMAFNSAGTPLEEISRPFFQPSTYIIFYFVMVWRILTLRSILTLSSRNLEPVFLPLFWCSFVTDHCFLLSRFHISCMLSIASKASEARTTLKAEAKSPTYLIMINMYTQGQTS